MCGSGLMVDELVATMSGCEEDAGAGVRRRGDDDTAQRGRRKQQAQQRVRRCRRDAVRERAAWFFKRFGSDVMVDARSAAGERGWQRWAAGRMAATAEVGTVAMEALGRLRLASDGAGALQKVAVGGCV